MIQDIKITTYKDFEIAVGKGKSCFVTWAKEGKIQSNYPLLEPGDHVYFNFGDTCEQALERILAEIKWLK